MEVNLTKNNFIKCGYNRYINLNNINRIEWSSNQHNFDIHIWYGKQEETYELSEDEFKMFQEDFDDYALSYLCGFKWNIWRC